MTMGAVSGEVPDGDYLTPFGVGRVVREGDDVTIVAIGAMVPRAEKAARELAKIGVSAEVIDPRSLHPFDHALVAESVRKTGHLVVVDEARRSCSLASEIVARVATDAYGALRRRTADPRQPRRARAVRAGARGRGDPTGRPTSSRRRRRCAARRWRLMAEVEIRLPKLAMTMQEGTIEEWLVAEGDAVDRGAGHVRRLDRQGRQHDARACLRHGSSGSRSRPATRSTSAPSSR